ncbi:hypothetical protein HPB47_014326 [Ixodes persulcatus]|uniref:Uncharacterized protein n=1 Tax=Ixodes persulcatus TaxID=34615 RepID=A0AC60QW90_IXOPE|nr:hypothetical protein HPB47_014326 [Ixodes persulcatus]
MAEEKTFASEKGSTTFERQHTVTTLGLPYLDQPAELDFPPRNFCAPPECVELLERLEASQGVPTALDLVLGPARPTAAVVDGVPTLVLIQDVLLPGDLLAQAVREAGLPALSSPPVSVSGPSLVADPSAESLPFPSAPSSRGPDGEGTFSPLSLASGPSSNSSMNSDSDDGEDSLTDATLRILRWLAIHNTFRDLGGSQDEADSSDSRRPAAFPAGPPHQPVRPKARRLMDFFFSLYGSHCHILRPLHIAAVTVFPEWVDLFSFVLTLLPAAMPFELTPVLHETFADASSTGLGICIPEGNLAIITRTPRTIF